MANRQFTQSVLLSAEENTDDLLRKFPQLKRDDGTLTKDDLKDAFEALGIKTTGLAIRDLLTQHCSGMTEFNLTTVVNLFCALKVQDPDKSLKDSKKNLSNMEQKEPLRKFSGVGNEWTLHTIGESERRGYAGWINKMLEADPDLKHVMPLNINSDELYDKVADGLVLCKLINSAVPETIHEGALNKIASLKGGASNYRMHENLNLAVNSAAAIGCCVVNVGAMDIEEKRPHIILGLIWQIIRIGLVKDISLTQHKELAALLLPGETIDDLRQLSPDELLLRWVNYHLEKAGTSKRINNFKDDIMDSEAYAYLLSQIAPQDKKGRMQGANNILSASDNLSKARRVLKDAEVLDAAVFVAAEDIAMANEKGKNRDKLNMAFVANLFNNYPALEQTDEEFTIIEETLEEKTYRNWMNSLGVSPFVTDLYTDLRNGLVLLQLMDHIKPGIVPWPKICKSFQPNKKIFQWQANCNYVIDCGNKLGLPMINIGAEDIKDGDRKLTLGLVFQMMRAYTLSLLMKLTGGDRRIEDQEIINWANQKLRDAGKQTKINSFKDSSIAEGYVILDLVDAIRPGKANRDLASSSKDTLDRASYILSTSRAIGGRIYALPEHVVQVNKNMIMTIFACLMILDYTINKPNEQEQQ